MPAPPIGGVSVDALAERYGTPVYVYDANLVLERIARIRSAVSYEPFTLLYSAKATPAVAVARLIREAGVGLDACSPGDLRLAELAGFTAPEISYTGFGASDDELRDASVRAGTLVVDGIDELERIAARGLTTSVGLRVNPAIDAGFHGHVMAGATDAKFGFPLADLPTARAAAARLGLRIEGLHAHIGSDVLDAAPHVEVIRRLAQVAEDVDWINVGGGFGTPRREGDREYDWSAFDSAARAALGELELRVEPGAHLTMDTGVLVTRVIRVVEGSGGRPTTLVVDGNTNYVISALLYQAHHPVAHAGEGGPPTTYRIAGNLMQAGDVLVGEVELPRVRVGDLLMLGHLGAYASSRAGVFNERPRPAEVLVRDGVDRLIRRAETVEELFARDSAR